MKIKLSNISIIPFVFMLMVPFYGCKFGGEEFELCGSGELWPYYHPELKNEQSFYLIKKLYFDNYRSISGENINGIVKIRFHVNCKGESGNFMVENYDLEYKKTELEKEISDQLLSLSKNIDRWIPAKDEDGELVNSHKFYAFRIEKGQLIDILPK